MTDYRIEYSQARIANIIKSLENAISICQGVDPMENGPAEKTYSYATGYSGSCMTHVVEDLQFIQSMLSELN